MARNFEKEQRATLGLTEDDELPVYVHQEFPKAIYPRHEDEDPLVVQTYAQEQVLVEDGWFATLAEARAHYANGDGEEEGDEGEEDEIMTVSEQPEGAPAPPKKRVRPPRKRRR
jgi:hypothetical protein